MRPDVVKVRVEDLTRRLTTGELRVVESGIPALAESRIPGLAESRIPALVGGNNGM